LFRSFQIWQNMSSPMYDKMSFWLNPMIFEELSLFNNISVNFLGVVSNVHYF
jgi:hypothetical protein